MKILNFMANNNESSRTTSACEADVPETSVSEVSTKESSDGRRENTRSRIALVYVVGFFGAIFIVFIIGAWMCYDASQYKDLLVTVSGILSGPLGFIVGYYFKASKE